MLRLFQRVYSDNSKYLFIFSELFTCLILSPKNELNWLDSVNEYFIISTFTKFKILGHVILCLQKSRNKFYDIKIIWNPLLNHCYKIQRYVYYPVN